MQLIAPDVLAEARGLSYPLCAAGVALGLLLWTCGWRWHRFWVVLVTTVAAGLAGLGGQPAVGPRMLAAVVLLAVGAGLMAIDLSRLLAFGAGGLGCWLVVQKVLPHFNEPMICFLLGGVLGIFLYRLQLMLLTSLAGTLLAGHSAVLLFEKARDASFPAAEWAHNHALGLNITVLLVALAGIAVQGQLESWFENAGDRRRSRLMSYLTDDEREALRGAPRRRGLAGLFIPW